MKIWCNAEIDSIYGLGSFWMFPHGNYMGELSFYGIRMPMEDNMLMKLFKYLDHRKKNSEARKKKCKN